MGLGVGITDDEVAKLLSDLEIMVPQQAKKWFDWEPTKKEHDDWSSQDNESEKVVCKINAQISKVRLEVDLQKRPMEKTQAMFLSSKNVKLMIPSDSLSWRTSCESSQMKGCSLTIMS